MSISIEREDGDPSLRIRVAGRFDFSAHQQFLSAFEQGDRNDRYIVDLADTSYLDSSALGMLLLLREHAGGDSARVEIINCNGDVRKILMISNFEQLFTIH